MSVLYSRNKKLLLFVLFCLIRVIKCISVQQYTSTEMSPLPETIKRSLVTFTSPVSMLLNYDSYFFFLGWTSKPDQVKAYELMT